MRAVISRQVSHLLSFPCVFLFLLAFLFLFLFVISFSPFLFLKQVESEIVERAWFVRPRMKQRND